jgi:hypothetical protein
MFLTHWSCFGIDNQRSFSYIEKVVVFITCHDSRATIDDVWIGSRIN